MLIYNKSVVLKNALDFGVMFPSFKRAMGNQLEMRLHLILRNRGCFCFFVFANHHLKLLREKIASWVINPYRSYSVQLSHTGMVQPEVSTSVPMQGPKQRPPFHTSKQHCNTNKKRAQLPSYWILFWSLEPPTAMFCRDPLYATGIGDLSVLIALLGFCKYVALSADCDLSYLQNEFWPTTKYHLLKRRKNKCIGLLLGSPTDYLAFHHISIAQFISFVFGRS